MGRDYLQVLDIVKYFVVQRLTLIALELYEILILERGMNELGKILIFFGVFLLVAGVVLVALGRTDLPLGRLPGDILYRGKHTTFYFPLATSILLSIVLSVVLYFVNHWKK